MCDEVVVVEGRVVEPDEEAGVDASEIGMTTAPGPITGLIEEQWTPPVLACPFCRGISRIPTRRTGAHRYYRCIWCARLVGASLGGD